jgi:hypothetical protein
MEAPIKNDRVALIPRAIGMIQRTEDVRDCICYERY